MDKVCGHGACGRPLYAKELCAAHYLRQLQGRDMDAPIRSRPRGATCAVDGCGRRRVAWGHCQAHDYRAAVYGDPLAPLTYGKGVPRITRRERNGMWQEVPTYTAVHRRLRKWRGPAGAHTCIDCGDPATEWAYDNADPAELSGDDRGHAMAYSGDVDHYEPMCHGCHRYRDAGRRRAERRDRNGMQ